MATRSKIGQFQPRARLLRWQRRHLQTLLTAAVLGLAWGWAAVAAAAPQSAIELRVRGLDAQQATQMLAQQGFRDPTAAARVLIAADYEPVAVERAL